jgi:hypothetical protein
MAERGGATLSHFDTLKFIGRDPWVASPRSKNVREGGLTSGLIYRISSGQGSANVGLETAAWQYMFQR